MSLPHILLALVNVVLWGFNFVVIKLGVSDVPPLFLSSMRYVFSSLPFILFFRKPDVPWKTIILFGMTIGFGQFALLFPALKLGLPAGLASLVLQVQAFFTMVLAAVLLGEKAGPARIFGAAVAFGGLGVIAIDRMHAATAFVPLLMCVGAALSWAAANIVNRGVSKVDPIAFIVWTSLVPIVPLFALSWIVEGPDAIWAAASSPSPAAIGSIAYLVFGATLIGASIWSFLMARYPAAVVAPFSLLVPVVGMASAAIVFHERVSGIETVGAALIALGLILNVFGGRIMTALRAK